MKIVKIDSSLSLRMAKKKSDVVKENSFVRILKPRAGSRSVGYIVQLLRSNMEFYCDNLTEYAGKIFASTLDDHKISMINPNSENFTVTELDRLDYGPNFAIAVLSWAYDNAIIRKDGTMIDVNKAAGFYGDFNKPETVRFKDQLGNLSTDFFVDIYGRALAGTQNQNQHIYFFEKLNTPGLMAYDVAGREFNPKDKKKLAEAKTLDLFNKGKLKLDDLIAANKKLFADESYARAVKRILLNKFEEMKEEAEDSKTRIKVEDAYKIAVANLEQVIAEVSKTTVEF